MTSILKRVWGELGKIYARINALLWGAPACVWAAIISFNRVRAAQAAAGIAYYALFSMFPLLLVFIAGGSSILEREQVEGFVLQYIGQVLPVPIDVLQVNIDAALAARGPIGITGFLGLLWSALGVFSALAINLNLAWTNARERNFFHHRLIGLLMIFVLVLLVLVSLIASGLLRLFIVYRGEWDITVSVYEANFWKLVSNLISLALVFLMYVAMYKFVPNVRARWRSAVWGALAATLLAWLATRLFAWYLNIGPANYELVYGSLGAVVALMFLIYILAVVTLFGAHLSAALGSNPVPPEPEDEIDPTVAPAQDDEAAGLGFTSEAGESTPTASEGAGSSKPRQGATDDEHG